VFNVNYMRMQSIIALLLITPMISCSSAKRDYQKASGQNTVEAYEAFLQMHPDAKQADQAKSQLAELEIERDWQLAESTRTAAGYRDYIAKHPTTRNCKLAKERLKELQVAEAWRKADRRATIDAYQNYLSTYPESPKTNIALVRLEALTAKRDWTSAQATNSIEAYQGYLDKHPSSKHSLEARQRLKPMLVDRDWRMAVAQNSEAGWVDYIVKYPNPERSEVKEAIKRLRRHKMVKPGGIISWERLGGKTWSQPLKDGFSNYEGSKFKSVAISKQQRLTYHCKNTAELKFPHWVLLNHIKVTGHLKACPDGFRLLKGLALIPARK
jgi:hypothetical protein